MIRDMFSKEEHKVMKLTWKEDLLVLKKTIKEEKEAIPIIKERRDKSRDPQDEEWGRHLYLLSCRIEAMECKLNESQGNLAHYPYKVGDTIWDDRWQLKGVITELNFDEAYSSVEYKLKGVRSAHYAQYHKFLESTRYSRYSNQISAYSTFTVLLHCSLNRKGIAFVDDLSKEGIDRAVKSMIVYPCRSKPGYVGDYGFTLELNGYGEFGSYRVLDDLINDLSSLAEIPNELASLCI